MSRLANMLSYEVKKSVLRPVYRRVMGKPKLGGSKYDCAIPIRAAKRILREHALGFDENGNPSWWYSAFDGRNSNDELTHVELDFITENVPRNADVLVTGCGVGLTTIWLGQQGYTNVEGFDYLPNVVASAKEIAALSGAQINYWQADGFKPGLTKRYDCITAMHWVYSAWMGNYNNPKETQTDREAILTDFLSQYSSNLKPGGVMLVELVDALLDHAYPPFHAYPVRHTVEQVRSAAAATGLSVRQVVSNPLGQRPIVVLYVLGK